jgi:hypothetical protein
VLEVIPALTMLLPGAKISTQVPQLEKDDRISLPEASVLVAPTVIAEGVEAGE